MSNLGFTYFDEIAVAPQQTIAELLASISATQRSQILTGFCNKIIPSRMKHVAPKPVVKSLYDAINRVEDFCTLLVRGEFMLTDEELDPETGEVITPATYQDVPSSVAELKDDVDTEFSAEFTSAQSGAVVDKMIEYSKHDGTGDASYYLSKITE